MIQKLNIQQTCDMFRYVGTKVMDNKPLLTEIDGAIGDGDHGVGMSIGFTTSIQKLNEGEPSTINDIFKTIGMSMINTMGGASGVIFGTMFAGGVKKLSPLYELDIQALSLIFDQAVQAVKDRGKASLGDKTMIDALEPAAEALRRHASTSGSLLEALKDAEASAKMGVENTKQYVARFGRAKTLGERAIGHQDAGATSVWIIVQSMREWLENQAV